MAQSTNNASKTEKTTNRPVQTIRYGSVRAAIWRNVVDNGNANAIVLFEAVEGQQFTFGKDYLIWFTNEECYFSRVIESDHDRDVLMLQKINPDRERFPDRTVHRREIARVALCVGVLIRKK